MFDGFFVYFTYFIKGKCFLRLPREKCYGFETLGKFDEQHLIKNYFQTLSEKLISRNAPTIDNRIPKNIVEVEENK